MNNPKYWADKNCKICGGTGEVRFAFDEDEMICLCAKGNKSDYEGEMYSDMEREEKLLTN